MWLLLLQLLPAIIQLVMELIKLWKGANPADKAEWHGKIMEAAYSKDRVRLADVVRQAVEALKARQGK